MGANFIFRPERRASFLNAAMDSVAKVNAKTPFYGKPVSTVKRIGAGEKEREREGGGRERASEEAA